MTVDELLQQGCEWIQGDDSDESKIVVSTRIRLARNLAEHPFVSRLSEAEKKTVEQKIRNAVQKLPNGSNYSYFNMDELEPLEKSLLFESHLISRALSDGSGLRSALISPDARFSLMLMEGDHLQIQAIRSGCNLPVIWEEIDTLDDMLEENLVYAWSPKYGYLNACPTNVGTGMRVSVMLHLPALAFTKQFSRIYQSLQKISLTVRGLYGEGSQAFGNFYQISNQATLGVAEKTTLQEVSDVVQAIVNYELRARELLMNENREQLLEDVLKNLQTLRVAETIGVEESMHCLSIVRLGISLGLVSDISIRLIDRLLLQTQAGFLQWIYGGVTSSLDSNGLRAQYLQQHLSNAAL